jgi:formylglycine-generating enzyme required for sulfatase activity
LKLKIPWKLFLNVIFNASLLFIITALAADATRGVRIQLRASEQKNAPIDKEVQLYGSSYALVIGINNYTQGWPRLSNAIRDAELVGDELRKKGFEVTFKKNLNSVDLKRTFEEFFVFKGEDPQARLFVWFAGHGDTQNGEGYLIPADAPLPSAGAGFRIKALSMRRFGEYVRLAQAKHALAVFDSCFSGTVFTTQRSRPPAAVTQATTLPVRQFISSGDENQLVSDDGRFRKLFIRALRGERGADGNGDGYLTGSELGMFLDYQVTNLTVRRQTPRWGKLRDEDYNRGDFVFLLASSGAVVDKPEKTGAQAILSVESNVTGARVLVDGRDVGSTNLSDIDISPGEHRIRVEKDDYEPYRKKILFATGRAISLYVDLSPKGLPKGRLYVDTKPEDARVRILNIKQRFLQGIELEPGRYQVEVAAEGYDTERRWIDLLAGDEAPFRFELGKRFSAQRVITNSIGMKFNLIPAGTFMMGSKLSPEEVVQKYGGKSDGFKREHPQHSVEITKPFYLQTTEVTQGQWKEVMGDNPSYWPKCGDDCPVENVSWYFAQRFIQKLNEMEGIDTYRLPTEAEWEYAVRAGTETDFSFGNQPSKIGEYAWYSGNSGKKRKHPVGKKKPNAWGLYDMHGSIYEWVEDDWHEDYNGAPDDGRAWIDESRGVFRVARGGAWNSYAQLCRSAYRYYNGPQWGRGDVGFRLARSVTLGP